VKSCERVENAVLSKKLAALLSAKYTETFNNTNSFINFTDYKKLVLRFKEIYVLLTVANICFKSLILNGDSLSYLNEFFKFLR
jgi:hypothetical protein